ncbi:MAG: methyl-accepting chemotaxis protein [Deltaproteobacteria bacterium]|nr:methyl-accepting chemotaxis protein [Deltaproteobacteria bacterium]
MSSPAQAVPQQGPPPKRRLRNYLLDARFQLKYTGMVVAVTMVVATILGKVAYDQSHAQTEMMTINLAMAGETADFIEQTAREADQQLLLTIIGGIAILVISLGITGIMVTHRVVGPAFKMKSLFRHVADGHLKLYGRLREGDELQDVFLEFERMIEKLRTNQRDEITQLESVIARAREASAPESVVDDLVALRDRMEKELQ